VDQAIEYYHLGLNLNPNQPYYFFSVIGEALQYKAIQEWDQGGNPWELFDEAEKTFRQGIEAKPDFRFLHLNLGWTYYFRGKLLIREGKSPKGYLNRAIEQERSALQLVPDARATLCIGSAYRILAEHDVNSGRSPERDLALARETFSGLLHRNPKYFPAHRELGRLYTLEGRWLAGNGGDPLPSFNNAGQALEQALALKPNAPIICLAEARRCLRMAEWLIASGLSAEALLARGLLHTDRAMAARERWAEAMAVRACLHLLQARNATEHQHDKKLRAEEELLRALTLNPHLEFEWGPFLRMAESKPALRSQ
jgi:tetratricopeptide (TPR) repeat protein